MSIQKCQDNQTFTSVKTFRGQDQEKIQWVQCDLSNINSSHFRIVIFDDATESWGHINADAFVTSDLEKEEFLNQVSNNEQSKCKDINILTNFENNNYGNWQVIPPKKTPYTLNPLDSLLLIFHGMLKNMIPLMKFCKHLMNSTTHFDNGVKSLPTQ